MSHLIDEVTDLWLQDLQERIQNSTNCTDTLTLLELSNLIDGWRGRISPSKLLVNQRLKELHLCVIDKKYGEADMIIHEINGMLTLLDKAEEKFFFRLCEKTQYERSSCSCKGR